MPPEDGSQVGSTVPATNADINAASVDSTAASTVGETVGNKADTAQTTVGTTRSLMSYLKGLVRLISPVTLIDGASAQLGGAAYSTLISLTGRGELTALAVRTTSDGQLLHIRIKVDGGSYRYVRVSSTNPSGVLSTYWLNGPLETAESADANDWLVTRLTTLPTTSPPNLHIPFKSSLEIGVRNTIVNTPQVEIHAAGSYLPA